MEFVFTLKNEQYQKIANDYSQYDMLTIENEDNSDEKLIFPFKKSVEQITLDEVVSAVNHPPHYNYGKYETIDVIEDWGLNFSLGNTVKYVSRAGHKDTSKTIEDLEKAQWYLTHEIDRLKSIT